MSHEKKERNLLIYKEYKKGKKGYKKLAKIFGLYYTTIAGIVRREQARETRVT